MSDISAIFPSMTNSLISQTQRRNHTHSILPEGNSTTTAPGATGAVQSFGTVLAGVTAASNAASRND